MLDAARRRLEQAEGRIEKAEQRADRLLQRGLSMAALDFLMIGYLASRFQSRGLAGVWWLAGLSAPALALLFLGLCVIQAAGVDRVGFVQPAEPGPAARLNPEDQIRNLAAQEAKATQMANWTARKKVNEVLQARAWFSRGFAALIVGATVVIVVWAQSQPVKRADPAPCTAVCPTTTAATRSETSTTATTASPLATTTTGPTTTGP